MIELFINLFFPSFAIFFLVLVGLISDFFNSYNRGCLWRNGRYKNFFRKFGKPMPDVELLLWASLIIFQVSSRSQIFFWELSVSLKKIEKGELTFLTSFIFLAFGNYHSSLLEFLNHKKIKIHLARKNCVNGLFKI